MVRLSQNGSSMLSVILASAVGVVVALAMATLMSSLHMSTNSIKFRSDADVTTEEMRALLTSKKACKNTFGGLIVSASSNQSITAINDDSVPPVSRFSVGSTYGDRTLLLNSMSFSNYMASGVPTVVQMTLTSYFSSAKKSAGAQELHRAINLSVEIDGTGAVKSCIALSKMSDGIWQRSITNSRNIYYGGGNVGIGTSDPLTGLHVISDITLGVTGVPVGRTSEGPGPRLYIGGALGDNSDEIYFQRFNHAPDKSELRLNLGDNINTFNNDQFTIGSSIWPSPIFTPQFILDTRLGYVSIGPTLGNYQLDVAGDINSSTALRVAGVQVCTSSGCTAASDARLKQNVRKLTHSTDRILKLQGVAYDWIDKEKYGHGPQIGFIAQDLENVFPEVVVTDKDTGSKSVAYDHLVAPLTESIKDLFRSIANEQTEREGAVETILSELATLKKENALLKTRLERLEQERSRP